MEGLEGVTGGEGASGEEKAWDRACHCGCGCMKLS